MKHFVSRDLYAYWDALRDGRTAPERADIDPAAIRHILAYTFVLEIGDTGRGAQAREVTFRLSGTRLNALFGHDLKDCRFDRIWTPRARPVAAAMLDAVLDDRSGVVGAAYGGPYERSGVDIEMLLLPLRHHGHTHSRVFGSLVAHDVPSWMGLSAAEPLDLTGFRTLLPGDAPEAAAPPSRRRADRAPIDPRPPGPSRPLPPQRVGRFRVYEGGGDRRVRRVIPANSRVPVQRTLTAAAP